MSDRRAGWLLVAVAGALGIVVAFLTYRVVPTLSFPTRTFPEGALTALRSAWPSLLMVVAIAVIGFAIGRNTAVRVWAAVVGIGTIVAVLVIGGAAAQSASVAATHTLDCDDSTTESDPYIEAAVDELSHPGPVDLIMWSPDSCGGIVRGIAPGDAYVLYENQLADAGWDIESSDGVRLVAHRDGYTVLLFTCGEDLAIEMRLDTATSMTWC